MTLTLIASHRSRITGLFTLSDTIVSKPEAPPGDFPGLRLPARDGPVRHANKGLEIAGLMQKSIIFGRTMVMWAGRAIVAETLIKNIRDASADGKDQINLEGVVTNSGLTEDEQRDVSLIYHYVLGEDLLERRYWRCNHYEQGETTDLITTGSGEGFFFDNLRMEGVDDRPAHETVLSTFMSKIISHSLFEWDGTSSLDYLYGGWFEIAVKSATSFQKIPYAIKIWVRDANSLGSGGPTLFGWYSADDLVISRHTVTEPKIGEFQPVFEHIVVPDMLKRQQAIQIPAHVIRPYFIGHVVVDTDERTSYLFLDTEKDSKLMTVEAGAGGLTVAWSPELRKRLFALRSGFNAELKQLWFPPDI